MVPVFKVNGNEYTELVESIEPSRNDLDADGSGRDITTGTMYRNIIARKKQLSVSLMRLWEDDAAALSADLESGDYITCTFLDPGTNTVRDAECYNSSIKYGKQQYDRTRKKTYYEGSSFDITER